MSKGLSIGFASAGALFGASSLYFALSDGPGEKARKTFEAELRAQRGNRSLAFAHTEERLQDLARAEKSRRQAAFWILEGAGVGSAALTTIGLVLDDRRQDSKPQPGAYAVLYGSAALMSGLGFYILSIETPIERVLRLYHDDPGLKLRAGVSALPMGGVSFGLSGTF